MEGLPTAPLGRLRAPDMSLLAFVDGGNAGSDEEDKSRKAFAVGLVGLAGLDGGLKFSSLFRALEISFGTAARSATSKPRIRV